MGFVVTTHQWTLHPKWFCLGGLCISLQHSVFSQWHTGHHDKQVFYLNRWLSGIWRVCPTMSCPHRTASSSLKPHATHCSLIPRVRGKSGSRIVSRRTSCRCAEDLSLVFASLCYVKYWNDCRTYRPVEMCILLSLLRWLMQQLCVCVCVHVRVCMCVYLIYLSNMDLCNQSSTFVHENIFM